MLNDLFERDMMFYTFDDFMKLKKHIKEKMKTKDRTYIQTYRMYVESRPWIKDFYRCCIWDYLNDYMTEQELEHEFEKYLKKYGDKSA